MTPIKTLLLAGLMAVTASLGAAGAAEATPVAASCVLDGRATGTMLWAGGTGDYDFAPNGLGMTCVAFGVVEGAGTTNITLGSAGAMTSVGCGIGWGGDATLGTPVIAATTNVALGARLANADYSYHFNVVGFSGVLVWQDPPENTPVPNPRMIPTATKPVGGGPITMTPLAPFPGNPPGGICTNGFDLHGTATMVFA